VSRRKEQASARRAEIKELKAQASGSCAEIKELKAQLSTSEGIREQQRAQLARIVNLAAAGIGSRPWTPGVLANCVGLAGVGRLG